MAVTKPLCYILCESATDSNNEYKVTHYDADTVTIIAELQDASEFNRNGRQYPKPLLDKGLNASEIVELIVNNAWCGEAGHPLEANNIRQMTVDPTNISHRVNKWWWEGDKIVGEIQTLGTEQGKSMKACIDARMNTSYSLRAMGGLKQTPKGKIVIAPFRVICYDWVILPSHMKSYQRKILNNGLNVDKMINESYIKPLFEQDMLSFAQDESKNIKLVSDFLNLDTKNIELSLNESLDKVNIKTNSNTIVVNLEEHISQEYSSFLSKL